MLSRTGYPDNFPKSPRTSSAFFDPWALALIGIGLSLTVIWNSLLVWLTLHAFHFV